MAASDIRREKSKWRQGVEDGSIGGGGGGGVSNLTSIVQVLGSAAGASNISRMEFNTSGGAGNSQLTIGMVLNGNNLSDVVNHESNGQVRIGTDNVAALTGASFIVGNVSYAAFSNNRFTLESGCDLRMVEKANHSSAVLTNAGLLWVRNDSPNSLIYTDDAGTDFVIGGAATPVTSTTTALENIANAINTGAAKVAGFRVFNTTTNRPVWAVGNANGSVWVDATGATAHTPV